MAQTNPRSAEWYRDVYTDVSASGIVAAATAGASAVASLAANETIFVQKITVNIQTSAAQAITFQDSAGTPVVALLLEASVAAGVIRTIDFGARGFALTEAKQLNIVNSAGPAYSYSVEGYRRSTSAKQASTADRTV